jgi:hypothetical protein
MTVMELFLATICTPSNVYWFCVKTIFLGYNILIFSPYTYLLPFSEYCCL